MRYLTKILSTTALSVATIGASASMAFAASPSSSMTATPGVSLRLTLDQLLGEHALVLEERMQALYSGNTAQYNALTSIMNQDTQQLTQAVSSIYGSAAGTKFASLWNQHMYFFNYVNAVKGENAAQAALTQYKNQFSQFLAGANPNLSESTLSTVLQEHINQITTALNDYAQGQDSAATQELVQDYNLMYTAGGYLAGGIAKQFPAKFDNQSPSTPAVNLQVALDQLLGEHAMILELAMQALYSGNQGLYHAYMMQMNANTQALTQAIASIYGTAAGQQFEHLWEQHQYFFTYVNDVKDGNTPGARAAQAALTQYKNQFSQFLAGANPNLSESTLSTVLQEHINQITTAFQDYVAGNDAAATQELMQDYNLMYTAGGYLAQGIVAQFPSKFDHTATNTAAGNLRVDLDQLLGEHALILELRMQALYSGNTNLYNAYTAVMNQNTQSLTAAITSIYGQSAGQKFESLWNEHMYFFSYVTDLVDANSAQATLTHYKDAFAAFLASADPHLSDSVLSSVLQEHIDQITAAFNDFTQGNQAGAVQELTADYGLMYQAADYLASGIEAQFPEKFASTSPNTAAGSLVSSLDQLLGMHAFLLEMRMQALYANNTAAEQAFTAAMNQNTTSLTQAIGSIYGPKAASEFETLWNHHMLFFTYAEDIKDGNASGAQAAQMALTQYKNQFSQFLAAADPHLSESTLSTVLQEHINQITTAFLDDTKGEAAASDASLWQDYNLMYTAGQYLASGIVAQFPNKFGSTPAVTRPATTPTAMMKGATSPVTGLPLLPIMGIGVGLMGAAGLLLRTRRQS
ncbi:hypothetical protein [Sulfobacillus sp. hq2]|uniref:hypothetical protein n=1 Tax=Sulfobacillus sp. hq2 TaxID=2039167 RepID=UPI000CD01D69|nr:hypothetical protein [Sulfobacillus sp. hq2]POB09621.1 hypothetical protein CO251_15555 [Sulfobacillus sp. hq2]